jgi:hypothetical protein
MHAHLPSSTTSALAQLSSPCQTTPCVTLQGTLIVVAFCRIAFNRLRASSDSSDAMAADARARDHENVAVGTAEAIFGLILYSAGKSAWRDGPLRGGLSVFGASPDLDRCASRERYLAEKLAEFSGAVSGGVSTLGQLGGLSVSQGDIKETVAAMISYAKRGARVQNILVAPEVGEAWSEFAARVTAHGHDMHGIARTLSTSLRACA